jgi:GNAT superfamily N-acetyltransferase
VVTQPESFVDRRGDESWIGWEPEWSRAMRDEISGGDPDPFGDAGYGLTWADKTEHLVARRAASGRLVGHLGVLDCICQAGQTQIAATGIGSFLVRSDMRGQGLGRHMLELALQRAEATGSDAALLFCSDELLGYYSTFGFLPVSDLEFEQPEQAGYTLPQGLNAMIHPLAATDARIVRLRLRGLPF